MPEKNLSQIQGQDTELEERYCSWCFTQSHHSLTDECWLSRNTYLCQSCNNCTLICRTPGCEHMTKGPASTSSDGFLTGLAANWHEEFCAEHDGTIASFENLGLQLDDITDYRRLFQGDSWDWATGAKIAAGVVAGATVVAPAALLAAPGVASALGGWGLLGASSTGTAISSLSGAALAKASLAAIGGGTVASGGAGIAGGTVLLSAVGGAVGGIRGGVVANGYFGQIDGFSIRKLSTGKDRIVFVNGFLQQNERNFVDWSAGLQEDMPGSQMYGVNWESKTLLSLGNTLIDSSKSSIESFMALVSTQAKSANSTKMSPLGWVNILMSLADNPWHTAMAKAGMTGILLAEILSRTSRTPYQLMGHSLGSRVLFYALTNLAIKRRRLAKDVYLLGGAVDRRSAKDWSKATQAVSGKIYNCYSRNDGVLKYLYQGGNALLSDPIGYGPIELDHPKIVNVDCTEIIGGHMEYKEKLPDILRSIHK